MPAFETSLRQHLMRRLKDIYKKRGMRGLFRDFIGNPLAWRQCRDVLLWLVRSSLQPTWPVSVTIEDCKFYLHPYDYGISTELFIYGTHEPASTKLFKGAVREGMVVVDIGSNLGYYAIPAARLVTPSGKVMAIEPEPKNFAALRRNVEANRIENMILIPSAIGSTDSMGKLYLAPVSNTHTLRPTEHQRLSQYIEVPVKRLDTLVQAAGLTRVDFIRMDIEGFEVEAVSGMWNTLKENQPGLMMELHCDVVGSLALANLLDGLMEYGYEVEYVINRDQDFYWKKYDEAAETVSIAELRCRLHSYRVVTVFLHPARKAGGHQRDLVNIA